MHNEPQSTGLPLPEAPPADAKRSGLLETFRFRNFRLLWFGLLISNIGTWMQLTALGFLVVSTAANEGEAGLRLGLIGISQAVPALLLSPVAGVTADSLGRKRILLFTNAVVALLALALAVIVTLHFTPFPLLMLISATSSAARTFDSPARQSWVPILVQRAYLSNAIGLNSLAFNAPSVIAPSIAGFLIGTVGVAVSFYINAACTLAIIIALMLMDATAGAPTQRRNFLQSFVEGVQFLAGHRVLRWIFIGLIVNSILVRPYVQLLPAYTIHALHMGPAQLGILLGASGLGAIIGAITTAVIGNVDRRARLWTAAGVTVGLCLAITSVVQTLPPTIFALVGAGFCTMLFVGSSNILIQSLSPDDMRGRAVSAFSMILLGVIPLGTLAVGTLSNVVGLRTSFLICGLFASTLIALIWLSRKSLREA